MGHASVGPTDQFLHPDDLIARLTSEGLNGLGAIANRLPGQRGATHLHPATLTRWILKGLPARDGERVYLEAVRVGSRWATSEPAVRRFFARLEPTRTPQAQPLRTPTDRRRASEAAAAALAAAGA